MDPSKILAAASVTELREATAVAFEELSIEKSLLRRIEALEALHPIEVKIV